MQVCHRPAVEPAACRKAVPESARKQFDNDDLESCTGVLKVIYFIHSSPCPFNVLIQVKPVARVPMNFCQSRLVVASAVAHGAALYKGLSIYTKEQEVRRYLNKRLEALQLGMLT